MLAPRKKLWSTPPSVIAAARSLLSPFTDTSVVYDVGCGDGRVLIALASTSTEGAAFVGVEIDGERAEEARRNVEAAGLAERITILCSNALTVDYSSCTHMFLYLVPRGLRIFKPVLLSSRAASSSSPTVLEVVTYMAGFADVEAVERVTVEVEHQEGAAWPVYYYRFQKEEREGEEEGEEEEGEEEEQREEQREANPRRKREWAAAGLAALGAAALLLLLAARRRRR